MKQFVAFSGGTDSTALALIEEDATPVFTDTGDEFDEVYAHIEKFERVTGRRVERIISKEGTLPEYIERTKFMPNHRARFCTRIFKIEALNEWLTSAGQLPAEIFIGLRADEPESLRVGNLTELDGLGIRYPLRERGLVLTDVIRVCLEWDLLPRRTAYMARGGCKGCYYKRKSEIAAMHFLAPATLDELQLREENVQDERGTFFYMFPNINMSIREFRANLDAQPGLFDVAATYSDAAKKDEMGTACGLFCNR